MHAQEQPLPLHHPRRKVQVSRHHPAGQGDRTRTFESFASLSSNICQIPFFHLIISGKRIIISNGIVRVVFEHFR